MSTEINAVSRRIVTLCAPALALLLTACGPLGRSQSVFPDLSAPITAVESGDLAPPAGASRPKVALILPLTQGGKPSAVGEALRQHAVERLADFRNRVGRRPGRSAG